jgi:hypothetical protein
MPVLIERLQWSRSCSRRALGDLTPVKAEDMWDKLAQDIAAKPYKALGMDLLQAAREDREMAVRSFMQAGHRVEAMEADGRNIDRELRERMHAEAVRDSIPALIASPDRAIAATETTLTGPVSEQEAHLRSVRVDAEMARRNIGRAATPRSASPMPGRRPSNRRVPLSPLSTAIGAVRGHLIADPETACLAFTGTGGCAPFP